MIGGDSRIDGRLARPSHVSSRAALTGNGSDATSKTLSEQNKHLHLIAPLLLLVGCTGGGDSVPVSTAESCMTCHNGSPHDDYAGPGLQNPHPFGPANSLRCTTCHGGNPAGADRVASHVPPPPEIGNKANQLNDRTAYFNRLTLTGIDKFPDYTVGGKTYTSLEYLQFINPGDLRVVTKSESCGQCHAGHAECVAGSLLATESGILSGAMFAAGVDNRCPRTRACSRTPPETKPFVRSGIRLSCSIRTTRAPWGS